MDFITFPLIAILSIFGLGLYTGYDSIVFDPISSPKWAQEQGYSPRVLTRQLTDEIRAVRVGAGSRLRSIDLGNEDKDESLAEIGEYFEIQVLVNAARKYVGVVKMTISGELFDVDDEHVMLRIRITDRAGKVRSNQFTGARTDLPLLLKQAGFETVKTVDPYIAALYVRATEQKSASVDFAKTYEMIEHCFSAMPESEQPLIFNLWGRTLFLQKKYEEAIAIFGRATELDPTLSLPYLNIGQSLNRLNRPLEALDMLEIAGRLEPNAVMIREERATAYEAMGRPEDAIAELSLGTELAPDNPTLHARLGRLLMASGRTDEASAALRKALRLAPTDRSISGDLEKAMKPRQT
ncbi:tetratricopeptide (TPR) repeat protein [Skermanella aerolata]|uniref:tetratricopeptide repeat protein n=1 Tax=Skermanella aerolata TaxID=393310 RepID=UPI003D2342B7